MDSRADCDERALPIKTVLDDNVTEIWQHWKTLHYLAIYNSENTLNLNRQRMLSLMAGVDDIEKARELLDPR